MRLSTNVPLDWSILRFQKNISGSTTLWFLLLWLIMMVSTKMYLSTCSHALKWEASLYSPQNWTFQVRINMNKKLESSQRRSIGPTLPNTHSIDMTKMLMVLANSQTRWSRSWLTRKLTMMLGNKNKTWKRLQKRRPEEKLRKKRLVLRRKGRLNWIRKARKKARIE